MYLFDFFKQKFFKAKPEILYFKGIVNKHLLGREESNNFPSFEDFKKIKKNNLLEVEFLQKRNAWINFIIIHFLNQILQKKFEKKQSINFLFLIKKLKKNFESNFF